MTKPLVKVPAKLCCFTSTNKPYVHLSDTPLKWWVAHKETYPVICVDLPALCEGSIEREVTIPLWPLIKELKKLKLVS